MQYTEKTLKTLEFDKIRQLLADSALTEGGRRLALAIMPTDREGEIIRRQKRTTDAKRLMEVKGAPSFGAVVDISDSCERALKGAVLTTRELLDVANLLSVSARMLEYIRMNRASNQAIRDMARSEDLREAIVMLPASRAVVDALRYVTSVDSRKMLSFELSKDDLHDFARCAETYLLSHLGHGFDTLEFYKIMTKN